MVSDEMRLIAATAYWEAYRDAWRPLAILPERFDVPFADMPNRHAREATLSAIGQALDAVAPAIRAQVMEEAKPVAWMRRWAFDNIDVMKLPKAHRPVGWKFFATSEGQIFPDDVPLYAALYAAREVK